MYSEIVDQIEVCEDCMYEHANGDISPNRPEELPEPWARITRGYTVTMGGEHTDSCNEEYGTDYVHGRECDCGDKGYSTYACEGCGDSHHGDRYAFTLWRATYTEATEEHARSLFRARMSDNRTERFVWMNLAGEWRSYIVERRASDRRFQAFMSRTEDSKGIARV